MHAWIISEQRSPFFGVFVTENRPRAEPLKSRVKTEDLVPARARPQPQRDVTEPPRSEERGRTPQVRPHCRTFALSSWQACSPSLGASAQAPKPEVFHARQAVRRSSPSGLGPLEDRLGERRWARRGPSRVPSANHLGTAWHARRARVARARMETPAPAFATRACPRLANLRSPSRSGLLNVARSKGPTPEEPETTFAPLGMRCRLSDAEACMLRARNVSGGGAWGGLC